MGKMDALTLFRDPEFEVEVPGDGINIAHINGVDPILSMLLLAMSQEIQHGSSAPGGFLS
jgi:hypothetical protein